MSKISQFKHWINDKIARRIQGKYCMDAIQSASKAIVFLTPGDTKINGGVMSIFSLCRFSRELNSNVFCGICTYPHQYTYARNTAFPNKERIMSFEQFITHATNLRELIVHIPEYYAKNFYKDLSLHERNFLKQIFHLHINILNQNIQLMPPPEKLKDLKLLTAHITQTTAHNRYASQEICNQWTIPTHLFSVYIPIEEYPRCPFEKKNKTIVLSPDENEHKKNIVRILKTTLKDWQLITVKKLTFPQYMDLTTKSMFAITFGEGFDGYFTQPCRVGSLAFAVYNKAFFPSEEWKNLKNVYSSEKEMAEKIAKDILYFSTHKDEYLQTGKAVAELRGRLYSKEKFLDNLRRFYQKQYDFLPQSR